MVKIGIFQGLRVAVPLKPLERVLKQWQKLMTDHPGWAGWEASDAPWWYGERASLSCLAGAIWKCQGWAFEEFKTRRRIAIKSGHEDHAGRCDFMFGLGKHQFIAEAKQSFCNIGEDAQRNASEVVLEIERLAIAWAFPEHSRNLALRQEPQYIYPGTVVLIRPLKLKNHESE
jgi:hypothetical protein